MNMWHELLTNVAIVAITTSVWTVMQRYVSRYATWIYVGLFGLLMALGTAGVMLLPVSFSSGVLLDLRYTFLVLAGFFGGPLATIPPTVVALVLRILAGGVGVEVGIPLILMATGLGLAGFWRLKGRIPELRHILALAAASALSGSAGFFVRVPVSQWPQVMPYVTTPLAALLFVSTTVAAFALANELRRQKATSENRIYRAIIEALPDCLNAKDMKGRFIAANPATAHLMSARDAEGLIGKTDFDFYSKDTAESFRRDEQKIFADTEAIAVEQRFRSRAGEERWLSTLKAPLLDEAGVMVGLITHNREITEQKKLEMRFREVQRHLADALASMADGLVMYDGDGTMLFCNDQYRALFPPSSDVRNIVTAARELGELLLGNGGLSPVALVEHLIRSGDREVRLADGRFFGIRVRVTGERRCLVVFSDITKAKQAEQQLLIANGQLESMANTDGLTGLMNRRAFDRILDESIRQANSMDSSLALLLLDIDSFKAFNDTYGHPEGDRCLQEVANRLSSAVRYFGRGVVARYGGEEIGIILPHTTEKDAITLAELLRVAVKDIGIVHVGSEKKVVTISAGVAAGQGRGIGSSAELLRRADEGLYAAKAAGRDRVRAPGRVEVPDPLAESVAIVADRHA